MKDITGMKFGRLTVLRLSHKDNRHECHWLCKCDCGNEKTVSGNKLRSGNTKSCGCMQKEFLDGRLRRKHGLTNTKLYATWENMKHRCNDPNNWMYPNYGGRGIKVCEEWLDSSTFFEWAFDHGYEEGLSIERINVNRNYEPNNCEWVPIEEQYLNRTDSHFVTAFGKTQTISEWAKESGLKYDTIERRLNQYGWDAERAVTARPWKRA